MTESDVWTGQGHEAQARSKQASKKRGQSLNHLLSFTLPPRAPPPQAPRRMRKSEAMKPFNRERYVNAQYRFVMKPTFDASRHCVDADVALPWHEIAAVSMFSSSDLVTGGGRAALGDSNAPTCPICLSPPSAPRITRCGHVFCYACILHYLLTPDTRDRKPRALPQRVAEYVGPSRRCPICWDDVHVRDVKLVHWLNGEQIAARHAQEYWASHGEAAKPEELRHLHEMDGVMTMRLMKRAPNVAMALPRSAPCPALQTTHCRAPDCATANALQFARVMLATPAFLTESLQRDLADVEAEIGALREGTGESLSLTFLHLAREDLVERMEHAAVLRAASDSMPSAHAHTVDNEVSGAMDGSYYFYQAASGQYIFLHPIDIKVLLSHFTSYAAFPDTLQVVVQAAEEGTMDENLRRRCKYLGHLPMSADVTFVEVHWPRTVALLAPVQEGIQWKPWEATLRQRAQRRRDKAQREERARSRAEKEAKHSASQFMDSRGRRRDVGGSATVDTHCVPVSAGHHSADLLSFRDSAMLGAEMHFPVHPGAAGDDPVFPSMGPPPMPSKPQPSVSGRKTVWGTPAAPNSAHEVRDRSSDARVMDEAWDALEVAHSTPEDGASASAPAAPATPTPRAQQRKPKLILTGGGRGNA
ncbi:Delta(24(24(1)))-sterol reductase [Malassezia sp. CBS 17886]|nr:Delta(24(24(1)))-sterol reductase [Malassezia sp. CBS 17886]